MTSSEIVEKALKETARQLGLALKAQEPPVSEPGAGPEFSEYFDFPGGRTRKRGGFRFSYGRPVSPTAWVRDGILCNGCGHVYKPENVPEVEPGAVRCPECGVKAIVDRGRD